MSRFSHLEFEETPSRPAAGPTPERWPDQDDRSCVASGDGLFRTGAYEPALLAYSRALRYNRDNAAAWVGQVRCLLCLGEYPEAVTWSSRALERFPEAADLLACKGLSLLYAGQIAEGVEFLDGAVEMRSPSAWVWLARGEGLLAARQNEDNAHRCFYKAQELSPRDPHLLLSIGIAYNRFRYYARARTPLQQSVHTEPNNPLALCQTGLMYEGLGERESAIGMFERALAAAPDYAEAHNALERARRAGVLSRLWKRMRRGA